MGKISEYGTTAVAINATDLLDISIDNGDGTWTTAKLPGSVILALVSGGLNLGTSNLTQTDATRTYDGDANDLVWTNLKSIVFNSISGGISFNCDLAANFDITVGNNLITNQAVQELGVQVINSSPTTGNENRTFWAVDTLSSAITVDMPSAATFAGQRIAVFDYKGNASANPITLDATGAELINGQATQTISTNYGWVMLYSDGTNWRMLRPDLITLPSSFVFVEQKSDLPTPVGGVITLADNVTYFFTGVVDLTGDRLLAGANTTILGGSSENCRIKSTGLVGTALITSTQSLPIRNITIEANVALNLSGDGVTSAIDWFGVNFTDCATIGVIEDYVNVIWQDCAILNSGGLTFDGSIGTIGFSSCLFNTGTGQTAIILPATLTVTRRFRIIYSSFVVLSGETGINASTSATIPDESYILDTVNFSGGGTYLTGISDANDQALFIRCVGIDNTFVNGQMYMQANTTATTVAATNTFYKVAGTTTASSDNSKYLHAANRLTNDSPISRKYLVQATLSFESGNGNVCEFGFYDSTIGTVRTPSRTKSTANAAGKGENISLVCVVSHIAGDYIEVHAANTSATNNIIVTDMNVVITEL
jgi:hypothetical protein